MEFKSESLNSQPEKGEGFEISETDRSSVKDWTDEEERRVKWKLDLTLLPIMALAFFALQIDRGNIATALTSTITKDLGVTTNQINVGTQLLSAGIVLLEIPSNILLQKVGPHYWLSGQVLLWSAVATGQAYITNYAQYLATRLLLGFFESGFIPGGLYYLSTWYKRDECSTRTTVFFFGNILAQAVSALIGAGLLSLDGVNGLAGWRWVFLIEGIIGLGIGFIFFFILPPKTGDGRPWIGMGKFSYYNERETYIIRQRIIHDDPLKEKSVVDVTMGDIGRTLSQPRIWLHIFITLSSQTGFQGAMTYAPSIIKSLGYTAIKANELASVPIFAGLAYVFLLALFADKTGRRGWALLFSASFSLIAYAVFTAVGNYADKHGKYASLTIASMTAFVIHIMNVGWLTVNCHDPAERCIALALIIMAANCGGISGSQVFRTDDAPKYHRAFIIVCSMVALSWVLIVVLNLYYRFNRSKFPAEQHKKDKKKEGETVA